MVTEIRRDHRLFVAADLPEPPRRVFAELGELVGRECPQAVPVPAQNLHVTLHFVGRLPDGAAPEFAAALFDALQGPVHRMRIAEVVARPRPGATRLLAAGLEDVAGTLTAHVTAIRAALDPFTAAAPETRPPWPHVTLARFRRPTRMRRFPHVVSEHVFDIDRITLYDSHIVPGRPPTYQALMTVPLGRLVERNATNG